MPMVSSGEFYGLGVAPLTNDPYYYTNVVLLCSFDGADAAVVSNDDSLYGHALTFAANAQLDTAQSKFGASSLYCDGVGDMVTAPHGTEWNAGAGQFTLETWIRFDGTPTTNAGFIGKWNGTSATFCSFAIFKQGSTLQGGFYDTSVVFRGVSAAWTPAADTWYHVCLERDASNVMRLYLNGVVHASGTFAQTMQNHASATMVIGGINQSTYDFKGWVDEARYTVGIARYSGAFTPASAAFLRPDPDPYFANVVLLLGFNGPDAATVTSDASSSHKAITFVGDAALETTNALFNSASLFKSSTGYVHTPDHTDFDFPAEFTIEMWVAANNTSTTTLLSKYLTTGNQRSWEILATDGGSYYTVSFSISTDGTAITSLANTTAPFRLPNDGYATKHHIMITRNASNLVRLFIDGVMAASATVSGATFNGTAKCAVLARDDGTNDGTHKMVDEIRITKGVCRYDSNSSFTPPTVAYPRS